MHATAQLTTQPRRAPKVGDVIDNRHRLLHPLDPCNPGSGFVGEDIDSGRRVRIKFAPVDATATENKRFFEIANVLANFDDANCVHVEQFGSTPSGVAYATMDAVPGKPLSRFTGEPFEPMRAAKIALAMLRGLGYAHRHGLVHRAFEPCAVMMPEDESRLRIVAFWASSILRGDEAGVSMSNFEVGTTTYLSPEQAMGEAADAQSDLYALGVVFFEMLTGAPPFEDPDPLRVLELQMAAALPSLPAHIPSHLALIVQRLTAKRRSDRYPLAQEAITDLELFVNTAQPQSHGAPMLRVVPDTGLPPDASIPEPPPTPTPQAPLSRPVARPPVSFEQAAPSRSRTPIIVAAVLLIFVGVGAAMLGPLAGTNTAAPVAAAGLSETIPSSETADPAPTNTAPTDAAISLMVERVNQALPDALPFAERHALLQQLAGLDRDDKVDQRLQIALDLLQAQSSVTPCATFAGALEMIGSSDDGYYAASLGAAVVPRTQGSACELMEDSLAGTRAGLAPTGTPETAVTKRIRKKRRARKPRSPRAPAAGTKAQSPAPKKPTGAPSVVVKKLDGGVQKFDE